MTDEHASSIKLISNHLKQRRKQQSDSTQRPSKVAKIDSGDLANCGEEQATIEIGMKPPNPRIQRYLVAIEYIGTRFSGAQKQPIGRTVFGVLEEAFQKFIGHPVSIFTSSRTDAGVHALSNVCHVDVERKSKRKPNELLPPHDPFVVKKAVNHFLQKDGDDMMVIDVRCVPSDFHARYKAQERTYFYRLLSGKEPLSLFDKNQAWHVPEELNLLAMQKACQVLVGHHDFSSFRGAACQANSPIRTLDELRVTEVSSSRCFPSISDRNQSDYAASESFSCSNKTDLSLLQSQSSGEVYQGFGIRKQHRCLVVTARSRSFLYHQVRLLVGVLKAVGTGDLTVPDVKRILEAKNVAAASPMAPACGLYLGQVKYDLPLDA